MAAKKTTTPTPSTTDRVAIKKMTHATSQLGKLGYSHSEIAKRLGCSSTVVGKWSKGTLATGSVEHFALLEQLIADTAAGKASPGSEPTPPKGGGKKPAAPKATATAAVAPVVETKKKLTIIDVTDAAEINRRIEAAVAEFRKQATAQLELFGAQVRSIATAANVAPSKVRAPATKAAKR